MSPPSSPRRSEYQVNVRLGTVQMLAQGPTRRHWLMALRLEGVLWVQVWWDPALEGNKQA